MRTVRSIAALSLGLAVSLLSFSGRLAVAGEASSAPVAKPSPLEGLPLGGSLKGPEYKIDTNTGEIHGGPQTPGIKPEEYIALAKLPDWSGDWAPNVAYMAAQNKAIAPPWNVFAQGKIKEYADATARGEPPATTASKCLPPGMPALMNQNHTFEFSFVPRKIYVFDEIDGNHLRRIYTDGRKLPEDPDLSYMGYSIGHWEGKVLVVTTDAILPEVPFRINDKYNIENGGDMHVDERIYLKDGDTLEDDLTVTDAHVLTGPWKYSRQFARHREPFFELIEAVCVQSGHDTVDDQGRAYFDFAGHQ